MPLFYEDIDVILIASDMDGTPNMLLEAAATGRAFIGNKIGNIPEFYTGKNGFMIDKKFDLYVDKLRWMQENREAVQQMGIEARNSIEQGWTWKIQAQNYKSMFMEILG
jgi:glycosyltransferase involved in cell wall biosynthesis